MILNIANEEDMIEYLEKANIAVLFLFGIVFFLHAFRKTKK